MISVLSSSRAIETLYPDNLDALLDLLRLARIDHWGNDIPSSWAFRGHGDHSWPLLPGVWRDETLKRYSVPLSRIRGWVDPIAKEFKAQDFNKLTGTENETYISNYITYRIFEEIILEEFQDLLNDGGFDEIFIQHMTGWKNMLRGRIFGGLDRYMYNEKAVALAQHSGMPTRFLDWTLDPIKALVFALDSDKNAQKICIWCLDLKIFKLIGDVHYRVKLGLPLISFVKGRRLGNAFLNAQDGCFTYIDFFRSLYLIDGKFPTFDAILSKEFARVKYNQPVLKRIIFEIDEVMKSDLRRRLYRDRKTLFHLMPSLERCADVAKANLTLSIRDDRLILP